MDGYDQLLEVLRSDDDAALATMLDADHAVLRGGGHDGVSTLLLAAYHGAVSCVAEIRLRGYTLNCWEAAALGETGRIREIVSMDPSAVGIQAPDGWLPLHLAVFFGHAAAARILLEDGAPVSARGANDAANTPLHAALAGRGDDACVELLLAAGADACATDAAALTPLHIAASRGANRFCTLLIAAGADPGARSRDGRTPADLAAERGFTALAAELDRRGREAGR